LSQFPALVLLNVEKQVEQFCDIIRVSFLTNRFQPKIVHEFDGLLYRINLNEVPELQEERSTSFSETQSPRKNCLVGWISALSMWGMS